MWDGRIVAFHVEGETMACLDLDSVPDSEPYGEFTDEVRKFQERFCADCPVFVQCALHAMDHEPYGTWGLTEGQRADFGGAVPREWSGWVPDPQRAARTASMSGVDLLGFLEGLRVRRAARGDLPI